MPTATLHFHPASPSPGQDLPSSPQQSAEAEQSCHEHGLRGVMVCRSSGACWGSGIAKDLETPSVLLGELPDKEWDESVSGAGA